MTRAPAAWLQIALLGGLVLAGCGGPAAGPTDATARAARAEVQHGALALQRYGCGACHRIPGIAGADGVVGPPLVDMARRVYIRRGLANTPQNMVRWIRAPQAVAPLSAMPDMHVTPADAQAMAAYLHRSE